MKFPSLGGLKMSVGETEGEGDWFTERRCIYMNKIILMFSFHPAFVMLSICSCSSSDLSHDQLFSIVNVLT